MLTFNTQFQPLTSRPFLRGPSYAEYTPCEELRPYISCFWEVGENEGPPHVLVIPDLCFDIIFEIDRARQKLGIRICGLMDGPVLVGDGVEKSPRPAFAGRWESFAVRFHFWAIRLFLDMNMRDIYNRVVELDMVWPGCMREFEAFFYLESTGRRIAWMEAFLMRRLDCGGYNPNFFHSVEYVLKSAGRSSVKEICAESCVSQRQMERLFLREMGMSIKRTASLVRYQNVWREVAGLQRFDVQEAVYRYGYADQSHLLNEFKRFHGMTPEQAKRLALGCRQGVGPAETDFQISI